MLERLKYVAIFTSNLDEFFVIRVGSLLDLAAADKESVDSTGLTYSSQLDEIVQAVAPLYQERDRAYQEIKEKLSPYGILSLEIEELTEKEKGYMRRYLSEEVLPILSPQIIGTTHP